MSLEDERSDSCVGDVWDQAYSVVSFASSQKLDGKPPVVISNDASRDEAVGHGGVRPVGQRLIVAVEDAEARGRENLVGARDHALDHRGRKNHVPLGVTRQ